MENYQLDLAREFVLHTRQNIFLTGRAGTGKTTFLQNVLKETDKNYIVVAPTGVAAINAGGVTIHSMFHFPLTAFVPTNDRVDYEVATTRYGLSKHIRYRADKAKLLRQLDLLIIDEISMVRSDLLDAIDYALQRVRRSNLPFGNVQLLVIGDLFQLAPVVKPRVWSALRIYYDSPFFFDALAWKESKPVTIELTKIYRQKNQDFIDILNRMRKGKTIAADIESLNAKYDPAFDAVGKQYITLSTHNRKVDAINEKQMNALNTPVFVFDALIEGQFSEHAYPADFSLRLKKGAQVMFIRNDAEGRYFNGKLAEIIEINEDHIEAQLQDGEALTVERLEWPNKKYVLNEESGEIEEKEVGKFSQYPLRLAWAITVHKSQGLTFERMAVDLGDTFAPGQAYVALSRCRSLEGMVLLSQMKINSVSVSPQIVRYHQRSGQGTALETMLEKAKLRFATEQLILAFDFSEIELTCTQWLDAIKEKELPEKANVLRLALQVRDYCKEQRRHGRNFQRELRQMLAGDRNQAMSLLKNRTSKAVDYFTNGLYSNGIMPIQLHIKAFIFKSGVSKYL
ncbi:MAG: AAA family ATPase [Saprospiraceae bacterium]|nr:AAA family ATPase [Saprospiraceae bacterium]